MTTSVAIVTGAASGIGQATAERFLAGGWRVAGVDIDAIDTRHSADSMASVRADLRRVGECRRAVAEAAQWGGRLDAVVNAAGVWTEGPSADTTEDEWDGVLDLNLKGLYFMCSAAIPHLRPTRGCIVNMSSDAGIQGNAGAAVYCASKGGVSNLTRALALELAPDGIRVNAVCPGDVNSAMLRGQASASPDPEAYLEKLMRGYPQAASARFIEPAEIAELIWFLAQPSAAAITGANISIDFGLSAGIT
ncbi:MAG TPA: SDR family oxidoreductase [Ilumatobacteraceae bacterium]|nr:SDR family oxidoreductase [Ilumatobacteraceae bacterium]